MASYAAISLDMILIKSMFQSALNMERQLERPFLVRALACPDSNLNHLVCNVILRMAE